MKIKLLLSLISVCGVLLADSLLDNYYQQPISNTNQQSPLDSSYTTSRNYANINQIASTLLNMGINAKVKDQQENSPSNLLIKSNTNVRDFISISAKSFGYTWSMQDQTILFAATNPVKPKPTPTPSPIMAASALSTNSTQKTSQVTIANNWNYSPSDKYISFTFARWAKQANYQLVWKADNDFEVQSSGSIPGGFKTAVNEVLKSFKYSDHPLKAEWYKNNVLVISNFGE